MLANDLEPKALLLLDNAPGHFEGDELVSDCGRIEILYMPPRCTPLIQPMDQNVIYAIKARYKHKMIASILANDNERIEESLKAFNLLNVIHMLNNSWNELPCSVIANSWKPLGLPVVAFEVEHVNDPNSFPSTLSFQQLFKRFDSISGNILCNAIAEWIYENDASTHFEILDDDEIVYRVLNPNEPVIYADYDNDDSEEENVSGAAEKEQATLALSAIDTVIEFSQGLELTMVERVALTSIKEKIVLKKVML